LKLCIRRPEEISYLEMSLSTVATTTKFGSDGMHVNDRGLDLRVITLIGMKANDRSSPNANLLTMIVRSEDIESRLEAPSRNNTSETLAAWSSNV